MSGGDGALDQYWSYLKENYQRTYSEVAADHMVYPRNTAELIQHNGFGIINDDCNETMAIWFRAEDDIIAQICFSAEGCNTCIACGSMVTELARSKKTAEAAGITPEDVIENLGGLPDKDKHCARLAVDALQMALKDYSSSRV